MRASSGFLRFFGGPPRAAIWEFDDMTEQTDRAEQEMSERVLVADVAERERAAVRRAVQRNARGNFQLAQGRFITPKDKDLDNLSP